MTHCNDFCLVFCTVWVALGTADTGDNERLFQGLNILLNTCNMGTVDKYTEFADHLTYTSLRREESVPVVNRR